MQKKKEKVKRLTFVDPNTPKMVKVDSEDLKAIGYVENFPEGSEKGVMFVQFKSGPTYAYNNVAEGTWNLFVTAQNLNTESSNERQSIGRLFFDLIKSQPERYPYVKVIEGLSTTFLIEQGGGMNKISSKALSLLRLVGKTSAYSKTVVKREAKATDELVTLGFGELISVTGGVILALTNKGIDFLEDLDGVVE